MRATLMNWPVKYAKSCTKGMDKILGVSNPDYFNIHSRSMKPLEKIFCFVAPPQECGGVVPEQ